MRILYDITKPCIEELRGGFRMAGMSRVARAWAQGVTGMEEALLVSALPRSLSRRVIGRTCLAIGPVPDDRWAAGCDTVLDPVMSGLLARSGVDRGICSRACGYISHHLTSKITLSARSRVLDGCRPEADRWIYHMPLPDPLPEILPDGCVPVANIYDVIPWIFRDTYSDAVRRAFTGIVESFKRHRGHIIVNSLDTRHSLVSQFDVDPARVHVVPLGCADRIIAEGELPELPSRIAGLPYMLYVASSGQRRKNIPTVIKAFYRFAEGRSDGPQLVIVGGGTEVHQGLADSLASGGNAGVHCLGYMDEPHLESLYSHARLGLYLSLYEGFGLPILEYMVRGVPVICGNETSLPEVAGDAAMLVDSTGTDSIATAMTELWVDRERRRALAAAGIVRAREHSWEKSVLRLKACYGEILAAES